MRIIKRTIRIAIAALSILFLACGNQAARQPEALDDRFLYASFRDIPGVTNDEIRAIEELQKQRTLLVYGMPLSTEAFRNENGEIRGYTTLLCEWLTQLFGIQFQPRLYKWPDLLAGLETLEIAFTGELTATPERLSVFHMTSDITSHPMKQYRLEDSRPLSEIVR